MEKQAPLWRVVVGGAIFASIVIMPLILSGRGIGIDPGFVILAALASPFLGAALIWKIVRAVNDRDDPRHAKRPPDAP